jgi:transcriptional regulator with XRE-family HTH domain
MVNSSSQIENISIEDYTQKCRLKIASDIKAIREKRGYSQEDLAEIMGVNRTTLSKIENGKFSISIDYIAKFSFHLGFDFSLVDK